MRESSQPEWNGGLLKPRIITLLPQQKKNDDTIDPLLKLLFFFFKSTPTSSFGSQKEQGKEGKNILKISFPFLPSSFSRTTRNPNEDQAIQPYIYK